MFINFLVRQNRPLFTDGGISFEGGGDGPGDWGLALKAVLLCSYSPGHPHFTILLLFHQLCSSGDSHWPEISEAPSEPGPLPRAHGHRQGVPGSPSQGWGWGLLAEQYLVEALTQGVTEQSQYNPRETQLPIHTALRGREDNMV